MSPTPARTTHAAIISAATSLLETAGLEAVTMAAVADRVGVRAPSLYKHVRDRAALIVAIADDAVEDLGAVMSAAVAATPTSGDTGPVAGLVRAGDAFRVFAAARPQATALVFARLGAQYQPSVGAARKAVSPIIALAAELAGPDRALDAARALTAFAYGFSAMEAGSAFRFGGTVDNAWRSGLTALLKGFAA